MFVRPVRLFVRKSVFEVMCDEGKKNSMRGFFVLCVSLTCCRYVLKGLEEIHNNDFYFGFALVFFVPLIRRMSIPAVLLERTAKKHIVYLVNVRSLYPLFCIFRMTSAGCPFSPDPPPLCRSQSSIFFQTMLIAAVRRGMEKRGV